MSSTSGVRNPSPWLSLWLKPSATIDRIVASDPRHRVLLLASLSGIFAIALLETLPNGVRHSIFKHSPSLVPGEGTSQPFVAATSPLICGSPSENAPLGNLDPNNTPIYQVAAGHYFVMGDNRDKSPDSRFLREVGCPPAENLIGRAEIIFYSGDRFLVGIPPVRRFERIGMAIE
jgi:Signal peptidase, peptidase S26